MSEGIATVKPAAMSACRTPKLIAPAAYMGRHCRLIIWHRSSSIHKCTNKADFLMMGEGILGKNRTRMATGSTYSSLYPLSSQEDSV